MSRGLLIIPIMAIENSIAIMRYRILENSREDVLKRKDVLYEQRILLLERRYVIVDPMCVREFYF